MSVVLKDIFAPSVPTERGKATHIGGDLKEKKRIVYCAGKGVFIRETAVRARCKVCVNESPRFGPLHLIDPPLSPFSLML